MNLLAHLTPELAKGRALNRPEVASAVEALLDSSVAEQVKADFLVALARKGETAEEIAAFALELRARAVNPGIDAGRFGGRVLDIVGTGADGAGTFNVSTCAMFVVAAAGVAVAKHGNRAITSKCGSADVLAALGANIELPADAVRRCLEATGVAFLFAPVFHPAFKAIAPVRKKLAQRTIFNILGPLLNPARPTHQLVGVFNPLLVPTFAEVLRMTGLTRALVVHGAGMDELSVHGLNTLAELRDGKIQQSELQMPETQGDLRGGDAAANATIVRDILGGKERGSKREIVLLNAGAALMVASLAENIEAGTKRAGELIDTGAAMEKLTRFIEACN